MKHIYDPSDHTITLHLTLEEEEALKEHGFGKFFDNTVAYITARVSVLRQSRRNTFYEEFDKLSTQEQAEVMNIINRRKQLAANAV